MDSTQKTLTAICILLLIGMAIAVFENIKLASENKEIKQTNLQLRELLYPKTCSPLGFCIGDAVKTNDKYNTLMNASYKGTVKKINGEVVTIDTYNEEYRSFDEGWLKHR